MPEEYRRPTKKQYELLQFIEGFIGEHGYGPSYREIMAGCNYSSVATVAVHINNLVASGHLIKKDHSARSLEVAGPTGKSPGTVSLKIKPKDEKWLVEKVESFFKSAETSQPTSQEVDNLYVLVGALKVLGCSEPANLYARRLSVIKNSL